MKLGLLVITAILSLTESPRGSEQPELVLKSGAVVGIGSNYRDTCGGGQLKRCPDPPVLKRGKHESTSEFYYRAGQYFFKKRQAANYVDFFDLARRNGAPRDSSLYFMAEGLFQQRHYTLALNINYRQQLETTRLKESILIQRIRFLKFLGLEKEASDVRRKMLNGDQRRDSGGFNLETSFRTVLNDVIFRQESIERETFDINALKDPDDTKKRNSEVEAGEDSYRFDNGLTHYFTINFSRNGGEDGRWRFLREFSVWRRQDKTSDYGYGDLEHASWQPFFELEYLVLKSRNISHYLSGRLSYTYWDSDWEELSYSGNYYAFASGDKAYAFWSSFLDFQESSLDSWSGYTAGTTLSGTILLGSRFKIGLAADMTHQRFPADGTLESQAAWVLFCNGIKPGMEIGNDAVSCYDGPDYEKLVIPDPFGPEFSYPYAYDSAFQLETVTPKTFWRPGMTVSMEYSPFKNWRLKGSLNGNIRLYPETFVWLYAPEALEETEYFRYDRSGDDWYDMTGRITPSQDKFHPLFGSVNRRDLEWSGIFSLVWHPAESFRLRLAWSGLVHQSNMTTNPNVYSQYRSGTWSLQLEQRLISRGQD